MQINYLLSPQESNLNLISQIMRAAVTLGDILLQRKGSNLHAEALEPKSSVSSNFTTLHYIVSQEGFEPPNSISKVW